MQLEELEAEIKKLPLEDRAVLARRIVESLDDLSEAEINALWVEEAERRLDEWEQARTGDRDPSRRSASPGTGSYLVKPITPHPDADVEIIEAAQYYEDRSEGLGSEET